MSQKYTYTKYGAGIGGIVGLVLNGLKQYGNIKKDPNVEFNWGEFLGSGILGVGLGAVGGYLADELTSDENEAPQKINASLYIFQAIQNCSLENVDHNHLRKAEKIILAIESKYGDFLAARPSYSGSLAKNTAINSNYDIDIIVQFKNSAFGSLKEMYQNLYSFFNEEFDDKDLISLRSQKVSTGLIFEINGKEVSIDIIPARKINKNRANNDLNLFVKGNTFTSSTRIKTNLVKQAEAFSGYKSEKTITRLLKNWKLENNIPIKSIYLELLVINAFKEKAGQIPKSYFGKLMMALTYIRDNIERARVVDPGNSNNVISETLSRSEKSNIADKIESMIETLKRDKSKVEEIFPI